MPRPRKRRCISAFPDHWVFSSEEANGEEVVTMMLDELETIRLIDREGLTQEQCAERMQVARTTVTSIYESARKKLAEALIDGKQLRLGGGHYSISGNVVKGVEPKGEGVMRVAVTYQNGQVFQHFGHTEQFKLYDIEDGTIKGTSIVDTNGSGHGALAGFLKGAGADALICGGIGGGAQNALKEAGIAFYAGVTGSADEAAQAFAEGRLVYSEDATCDHHGHGHHGHGEGHSCGHHDGGHDCGHHGSGHCGHHGGECGNNA